VRKQLPGWAWLPVGVIVGLAAARLAFTPWVVERWPAAGASVPATTEIRITFDRPMDEASVLERLHVDAVQAGEVRWQGCTLTYWPAHAWTSGATVEVRLDAGAKSKRGLGTLTATSWSFAVAQPRLAYLWPADGPAEVRAWVQDESEAVPLTAAPAGVTDFSIGKRGTSLVYVTAGAESEELRELDLVTGQDRRWFGCPEDEHCTSPELSPDGTLLGFVRAPTETGTSGQGISRVWFLEEGGESAVAVSAEGDVASAPFWSPQGWLAYVDSTRGAILVVDPARGEPFTPLAVLPSSLGERGVWSGDGDDLIYPDLILPPESSSQAEEDESSLVMETHLFRWEVPTGGLTDLTTSGGWQAEDASPTFTTDGEWVIFSRRLLAAGEWTPGKQLWRMRPDGSQAEPLTAEVFINHGAPAAGPRVLAYLRFDLQNPGHPAQIWWLDVHARTGGIVAAGGYLLAWIP
jgi:hypothetical protein